MIWHWAADGETPPPLLGPPPYGYPGGAVLRCPPPIIVWGHPGIPSLRHHLQHVGGYLHTVLDGTSQGWEANAHGFGQSDQLLAAFFYADGRILS